MPRWEEGRLGLRRRISVALAFASQPGGGRPAISRSTQLLGSKRRIPLGFVLGDFDPRRLEEAVQAILGDVAKGRDPDAERKEAARRRRSVEKGRKPRP